MAVNYQEETSPIIYEFLGYLQVERAYSPLTIYNYFIDLRLFFRFVLCHKQELPLEEMEFVDITEVSLEFLESLERADISLFLTWLTLDKGAQERTRNRKISVLKSFFKYLNQREYLEKNIMTQITASKTKKVLPKYLEEDAIEDLLQAVNGVFWLRDSAMILLMVSSGLRVSEVVALDISSVHEDYVLVTGKGGKERQVYLSDKTKTAVSEYLVLRQQETQTTNQENQTAIVKKQSTDALFLSKRKGRLSVRTVQETVDKYLKSIGKSGYSCHKLRHTAATQMMKNGANLREIQEILGHECISTTEIYTHVENGDLKKVADNLKF